MTKENALERRLRRTALRRGLRLRKSRRRDRNAIGYGGYMLVDPDANTVVLGAEPFDYSASLEDIAEHFERGPGA